MGYKLAGFDVIGNVEIDAGMMELYMRNHKPMYPHHMDVRKFRDIPNSELPADLFNLDILDGSPPCSTFSIAGKRERKWGKSNVFREGQTKQRLDMLFFDYIDIAEKLKPKVVIAENVKGLLMGNAKGYVSEIIKAFDEAGYMVQVFLLNAATMGVPQARERVFFIAGRKDLDFPRLTLKFNEDPIFYGTISSKTMGPPLKQDSNVYKLWKARKHGDLSMADTAQRLFGKSSYFNTAYLYEKRIVPTIASTAIGRSVRFDMPNYISDEEIILSQSFPQDYDFYNSDVQYVCGMSVPPLMMYRIANEINSQWLSK